MQAGEVLGIYGLIGSGRSEFARAVFGLDRVAAGTVAIDGEIVSIHSPAQAVAAGVAYLPEDRLQQGIFRGLSVRANTVISTLASLGRGPLTSASRERGATDQQIERLAIKCRGSRATHRRAVGWQSTKGRARQVAVGQAGRAVAGRADARRRRRRQGGDSSAAGPTCRPRHGHRADQLRPAGGAGELRSDRGVSRGSNRRRVRPRPKRRPRRSRAAGFAGWRGHAGGSSGKPRGKARRRLRSEVALAVAVAGLFLALGLSTDSFFTANNLRGLFSNAAVWIVLSLGAASVILAGGIDISLGSLVALSAAAGGLTLKLPWSPALSIPAAVLAALLVGAAGGLANAALSLWGRVHPIVVTLGTMTVYRGLMISWTGGDTITDLPADFVAFAHTQVLGTSGAVVVGALVALMVYVWLGHFRGGRQLLAFGASPTAARQVGISPARSLADRVRRRRLVGRGWRFAGIVTDRRFAVRHGRPVTNCGRSRRP